MTACNEKEVTPRSEPTENCHLNLLEAIGSFSIFFGFLTVLIHSQQQHGAVVGSENPLGDTCPAPNARQS